MAQSLADRGLNTVELPLLKLSIPTQGALPFSINANDVEWNHYTDQPIDRLILRIETFRPYQETTEESQALGQNSASKRTCKISVWSALGFAWKQYLLDVLEYVKQWNHAKVKEKILNVKHKDNGILIKALSPLSQLNHSLVSSASSVEQLFSRVQVRCANTTDAQKIADTLLEFCPGIYGGFLKNRQTEPTQSISKTQIGATPRIDQSTLLTESQMGGRIDWQGNDGLITHQRHNDQGSIDQDGFRRPPPPFQGRQREPSRMDIENDLERYQRQKHEGNIPTNYQHRFSSHQASLDFDSPMVSNCSEAPARQPQTPALSLRGCPEPDRYQYPRNRPEELVGRDRIIAHATIDVNDLLVTPVRKRGYEDHPESYTQAETNTSVRFPLHPNSSPRAPSRQLQNTDSPLSKRIKITRDFPLAESYENQAYAFADRPLIDMDTPSIRYLPPRPDNQEKAISTTAALRSEQVEGGQIKQVPVEDKDLVLAQIQTQTGLYSLGPEELESVVHQVLAEDGFADFVKSLQGLWQARVVITSTLAK